MKNEMMKCFWIILLLNFTPTFGDDAKAHLCCDNEGNLMENKTCISKLGVRKRVDLKCKDKIFLNHNLYDEDEYTILENGSLYLVHGSNILEHNDYCLVNTVPDEEYSELQQIAIVCTSALGIEFDYIRTTPVEHTIRAILIFISVFFILLTLYIYYLLPELRETQDKVTIFTLINLAKFLFFLGILQFDLNFPNDGCVLLAFLVFFFSIAYFSWLNCTIANVWKIIVLRNWKVKERNWYLINHIFGWIVPLLLTTIVAIRHGTEPTFGINSCWFNNDRDQMYFMYLPICIMLIINLVLCLWSSLHLMKSDFSPDTRKALRYKSILYLKIFLLGGITWIFEVLSFIFNNHKPSAWLWDICDLFNCLHGVLIFIILIIWRQRIRKELAGKRILGFTCPSTWADIYNEEEMCLEGDEEKSKYDLMIKTLK